MPPGDHDFDVVDTTRSRRVAVIGSGYVGLTLSACLAEVGHQVRCTDRSIERVAGLRCGEVPIVEDRLSELVATGLASGRLSFGVDNVEAARTAEFVFLCLPTPGGADGQADLSLVEQVVLEIGSHLAPGATVITKSTVPVGTSAVVEAALGRSDLHVVANPEFFAEGSAVRDCLDPDRIVVGARSRAVAREVASLYGTVADDRSILTDPPSAELIKYACNAYLATRLTFVNSMAELCEAVGADIRCVTSGMGSDRRIGGAFLHPGPGWGGSCFPKDTSALLATARRVGCDLSLLNTVVAKNADHTRRIVGKAVAALGGDVGGRRIAVWGLTFKAGTDDLRRSPALEIARLLLELGADVHGYDPTTRPGSLHGIEVHPSALAAAEGAALLIVATEWDEFARIHLADLAAVMASPSIVDARNLVDPEAAAAAGFSYRGVGIPTVSDLAGVIVADVRETVA